MYTSLNHYHLWSSLHQKGSLIPKGRGQYGSQSCCLPAHFSQLLLLLALPVFILPPVNKVAVETNHL